MRFGAGGRPRREKTQALGTDQGSHRSALHAGLQSVRRQQPKEGERQEERKESQGVQDEAKKFQGAQESKKKQKSSKDCQERIEELNEWVHVMC